MTKEDYISEIRSFCKKNANPENVKKYSHYFKTEYLAYGLTTPQMHEKAKELVKANGLNIEIAIDSAVTLIESKMFEETTLLLLTINGLHKQFNKKILHNIEHFYETGITNWAHADTLGMFIIPKFYKQDIIQYSELSYWLKSKYKFQRRTVPVSMIKLLKTTTDLLPLFKFIEPLILDSEREVHQGVGWFLREAWKKQREITEEFLLHWKDKAPRLIIQYATEKMTSDQKLVYKRSKFV